MGIEIKRIWYFFQACQLCLLILNPTLEQQRTAVSTIVVIALFDCNYKIKQNKNKTKQNTFFQLLFFASFFPSALDKKCSIQPEKITGFTRRQNFFIFSAKNHLFFLLHTPNVTPISSQFPITIPAAFVIACR